MLTTLKTRAKELKRHTLTVYCVARNNNTPMHVRVLALLVAAYALSPIDLIPDFIPVLGYLDDLILVPLGLALVVRLTPKEILGRAKTEAANMAEKPVSYSAAVFMVLVWVLAIYLVVKIFLKK